MTQRSALPEQPDQKVEEEVSQGVEKIDGSTLKRMFEGSAGWLERHVPHINSMNVFPVPDGDTGTNMMLTVKSAVKELREQISPDGEASCMEVARRMARGALMGARGNSGVILSQILRGFAEALEDKEDITASDLANALGSASDRAYRSVVKPVEGTILTVVRAAAERARTLSHEGETNIVTMLREVVKAAREAELKTPELLPILKEAGVTDSGGHGLWVFLDGALRNLSGESLTMTDGTDSHPAAARIEHPQPDGALEGEWGYDVQYLIKGSSDRPLDVEAIREYITGIGDCPLVVGDEMLVKVHVHCENPGPAITYGADQGTLADVVIENMDEQAEEFMHEEPAPPTRVPLVHQAKSIDEVTGIGIVAVSPGEGLSEVFRSLGVSQIVSGGQSMNPSTNDLLKAVEAVGADTVILLPNNKNVIMAANQVPQMTEKQVHVLPTRTVPEGIAAVMSFNYAGGADDNLKAMKEALDEVQTGEVTTAVRTTTIDDVAVTKGDTIGLLNGKLVVAEKTAEAAIRKMLEQIDLDEFEIVTFYYGESVSEEDAEALVASLASDFDSLEMDFIEGGQLHYQYIFSIE